MNRRAIPTSGREDEDRSPHPFPGAPRRPEEPPAPLAGPASWLWSVFFALSAVGGAPPLTYEQSRPVLLALFLAAAAATLVPARRRLRLPGGVAGLGGFVGLAALALPGLLRSDLLPALDYLTDLGRSALLFVCFHHLARAGGGGPAIARTIGRTLPLVAAFAIVSASLAAGELRDWTRPCGYPADVVFDAGFFDRPTHWAIGLAYALPAVAFFGAGAAGSAAGRASVVSFASAVPILLALFFTSSRLGALLAATALGGLWFLRTTRRRSVGLLALVAGLGVFAASSPPCVRSYKLGWLVSTVTGAPPEIRRPGEPDLGGETDASALRFRALDELSTGRVTGVLAGLVLLRERPLSGYGIGRGLVPGEGPEEGPVHNLFLRWALDVGVLTPLLFLGMVGAVFLRGRRALARAPDGRSRAETAALALIVIQGIVVSLFEPHVPVGSFDVSALWWAAAGALVGRRA